MVILGKYTGLRQCKCGEWPTIGNHPYHTHTDLKTGRVTNHRNSFGVYCESCKQNTSVIGVTGRFGASFAAKCWNQENKGPFSLPEDFEMVKLYITRLYMGGKDELEVYTAARSFEPHPKYNETFMKMEIMSIFDQNAKLFIPKISAHNPKNGSIYTIVTSYQAFKLIAEFLDELIYK